MKRNKFEKPVVKTLGLLGIMLSLGYGMNVHAGTANLTGQYFGKHELTMATPGDAGTLGALARLVRNENDTTYGILGWNMSKTYWLWDFDNHTITFGSSNLAALNFFATPHYRVYSPTRERVDGELYAPDMDGPIDVDTMKATFIDNGDGTYSAELNFQIYFGMAGYPMGKIYARYEVTKDDEGHLKIITLDEGPDGRLGADGEMTDNVPGVVLPSLFEDPLNGVFPLRVSPYWDSELMTEITMDTNDDGIPDAVAKELGLLAGSSDTDGDGIADIDEIGANWAMPLDSDNDYVPDVLEAGDAATDATVYSNMLLASNEKVTITALNGDAFNWDPNLTERTINRGTDDEEIVERTTRYAISSEAVALEPQWIPGKTTIWDQAAESQAAEDVLPSTADNGKDYIYDMGTFQYFITSDYSAYDGYKGIERIIEALDTAESNIPYFEGRVVQYEGEVADYQALLDQAITDGDTDAQAEHQANVIRYQGYLDSFTERLVTAREDLIEVQASTTELMSNSRWAELGLTLLGSSFSEVSTPEELEALATSLNIVPDDLEDSTSYEIYFEHGVPEGLKVIRLHDIWLAQDLYDEGGNVTGSEPTNWQPEIGDVSFVAHEDGKTITVTHNKFNFGEWVHYADRKDFINPMTISPAGYHNKNLVRYQIVLAHTDANRAAATNTAPVIEGSPATTVVEDETYSFTPMVADANADELTFSIANKPAWADFYAETGELIGIPSGSDIGTTSDIVISVSDGMATAELAGFNITVDEDDGGSSGGSFFWMLLPALLIRLRQKFSIKS